MFILSPDCSCMFLSLLKDLSTQLSKRSAGLPSSRAISVPSSRGESTVTPMAARKPLPPFRASVWAHLTTHPDVESVKSPKSDQAPPQYPAVPRLDRLDDFFRRVSSVPTKELSLIAPFELEPRPAHLLPLVPGRSTEGSSKDKRITFKNKLFRRVRNVDRNRFSRVPVD